MDKETMEIVYNEINRLDKELKDSGWSTSQTLKKLREYLKYQESKYLRDMEDK